MKLLILLPLASRLAAGEIAIVGATVVDGTGAEPVAATVLIRDERIAAVGAGLGIPAGARVIHAEGHTLLPGLFDLHTHAAYGDWPQNMAAYLKHGVTTVVDFGTYPEMLAPMRKLLASGAVPGPRVAFAARITTPGGHGAEGGRGDFFSQEVLTPREGRAAVRRVLPYQPDAIKVFTDGWRYGVAPDMTSMEEDTLAAIVDEAHRQGLPVLTHTVTLEKAKIAAHAGVDVIAHGIGNAEADSEVTGLMESHKTWYVPTLAVYEPRGAEPARTQRWEYLMRNTARLRGGGILFGAGTDAGMTGTYHGVALLRELELLVAGGLAPLEAITAATGNSARALRVDAQRGTIAAGKLADLVLVEGAPYRDIAEIHKIRRVFVGGREVAGKAGQIPPAAVGMRIDDFEARDGRSSLGTLWLNSTDAGHDHSRMSFARTLRGRNNHALSVIARMAEKDRPFVRVNVPLHPGGVEPADVRAYRGIVFQARGDGAYRLIVPSRRAPFAAPFRADARWRTVRIPFRALQPSDHWTGTDLLMLSFEIARPAGESGWLELDNVRFFK